MNVRVRNFAAAKRDHVTPAWVIQCFLCQSTAAVDVVSSHFKKVAAPGKKQKSKDVLGLVHRQPYRPNQRRQWPNARGQGLYYWLGWRSGLDNCRTRLCASGERRQREKVVQCGGWLRVLIGNGVDLKIVVWDWGCLGGRFVLVIRSCTPTRQASGGEWDGCNAVDRGFDVGGTGSCRLVLNSAPLSVLALCALWMLCSQYRWLLLSPFVVLSATSAPFSPSLPPSPA